MSKRFAIIGAGGFVAPRHFQAINDVGGEIAAICDIHDALGAVDRYNIKARCFHKESEFFRFVADDDIDYVSICTPNYLHCRHIRSALRARADVISEKPVVLNMVDVTKIQLEERLHARTVYAVLQLRYSAIFERIKQRASEGYDSIHLEYHTPRGEWYNLAWKTDIEKSGGLIFNIGSHMFDLLIQVCGGVEGVTWNLSTAPNSEPVRTIVFDDDEPIDLSGGFTDLHTTVYREILAGRGIGIDSVRPSIELMCRLKEEGK